MKIFLVLLFVGCASATLMDALEKASDEVVRSIREAMEEATPLHEVLGIEESDALNRFQNDVKDELIRHVKQVIREAIEKIETAVESGKKTLVLKQLRDLETVLHKLDIKDHEIEAFKEQLKDHVRKILEGFNLNKRSIDDLDDPMESMLGDLSFRDFFLKIKQYILEKMDVSSLKLGLNKAVKQASQSLCNWITNKGAEKLNNFFDRVLEKDENEETRKRSVSDLYEQLKDYFDDLHLDFKEKFAKFGEWVKNLLETGLEKSKDKIENVRKIARELIVRSKDMSKEAAGEALEFLHKFKDQLGNLYEEARDKLIQKILDYTD
ncbi:uncharacterized protein LOC129980510 [Argiope bruennichi]|uniref:uncharacterized protein LOC129980510 n=1 Tax=Argiope bruennichi TaxID=94029 RepID=UPI0024956944|nr:uncharacterized protein LOC129980510 [Argiope bruennichi]